MFQIALLGQIVLSMLLGSVLGWQRTQFGKPAGLRTYALVTSGATLFTIISIHAFFSTPAQVAANIVTGIGFLCAGIILHRENRVEGLTTAAGLWMASAIGMAVGLGYYILASGVTFIVLLLLMIDDTRLKKDN